MSSPENNAAFFYLPDSTVQFINFRVNIFVQRPRHFRQI